jgi:hypothetical protein
MKRAGLLGRLDLPKPFSAPFGRLTVTRQEAWYRLVCPYMAGEILQRPGDLRPEPQYP